MAVVFGVATGGVATTKLAKGAAGGMSCSDVCEVPAVRWADLCEEAV